MILHIEEEVGFTQIFREALIEEGFDVLVARTVDEALSLLQTKKSQVRLIILDIMMPTGEKYEKEETLGGRRTGLFLINDIRKISADVPIIVLTGVSDPRVIRELNEKSNCIVLRKADIVPLDLVKEVRERLS